MNRRVIVALTGASGAVYGIRALEMLRELPDVETHLVLTKAARATIDHETDLAVADVRALADVVHSDGDLGAPISSGSFRTAGMLVAPCSVKTLSGIATSYDDTLVVRAADVVLKERRPLVLLLRETPLHAGHIRLMADVTASGAIVMPPVPAFYTRPVTIADIIDHTVGRALDALGIETDHVQRWDGQRGAPAQPVDFDRIARNAAIGAEVSEVSRQTTPSSR
ncbi:UbiX family flavin prenyltransferase [Pseudonocardia petroleophila]|uniref:Flavin prenyltransferase UbiX n=1 Tax=Pseudonocardia petroleophila TaxID=37331 RepID=A0A7G7MKZ0_9PSEU|nr:UbiX family flavin prenyltransferase [Pseudonocardia petroleophila]QNG53451.1 UbiX family flavin prenyltransferase [Pseudonocardia petroleophila]